MITSRKRLTALVGGTWLVLGAAALALAGAASAHPYFLHSSPAPSSVVPAGLSEIDITYTEALDLPYCKVVLVAPDGTTITTHQLSGSGGTELSVDPDQALNSAGTYAVEWTAVGQDGHTVFGTFPISLGHVSQNPDVVAGAAPDAGSSGHQSVLDQVLRAILPAATVLLAGLLLLAGTMADAVSVEGDTERRERIGSRLAHLRWGAWAVLTADVAVLSRRALGPGGLHAFVTSELGRLLIVQLALAAVAAVVMADRGDLRQGRRPSLPRREAGTVAALALLADLADSGHGGSAPASRHLLALVVYAGHLTAVSVWLGAIVALVVPLTRGQTSVIMAERARRLRGLVSISVLAVLGTGLATTSWGLRSIGELVDTTYGGIISAKLALFTAMLVLGAVVALGAVRRIRPLVIMEAGVAGSALVLAGILGQLPQPITIPLASQVFGGEVGLPIQVTSAGSDLLVGMLSPGLVGGNTVVVQLDAPDINDFLQPVGGVEAVTARLTCGCSVPARTAVLQRTPGTSWWTGNVDLPVATTWSVEADVQQADPPADPHPAPLDASLSAQVLPADLPHQVVIGVAAGLSGPEGQACQDEIVGMETAVDQVNTDGSDHGDLIRVVTVDTDTGTAPAMARLRQLRPEVIVPCGSQGQDDAVVSEAHQWGVPTVAPVLPDATAPGVWTLSPNWTAEGRQIASQAEQQGATSATIVSGSTSIDTEELTAVTSQLRGEGISYRTLTIGSDPTSQAEQVISDGNDTVIFLADPDEALPLVEALSNISATSGWEPSRGILASDQLMDVDFINDAGQLTRVGAIEFASDLDPFDPFSQYYAQSLLNLFPGFRPTFQGLHGYSAALVLAKALAEDGGHPSTSALARTLATRFRTITAGSYRGSWTAAGGGATQMAFFRSTYINPMALPSFTPAGAQALGHEGTFLDTGGFEQVTPFRSLS